MTYLHRRKPNAGFGNGSFWIPVRHVRQTRFRFGGHHDRRRFGRVRVGSGIRACVVHTRTSIKKAKDKEKCLIYVRRPRHCCVDPRDDVLNSIFASPFLFEAHYKRDIYVHVYICVHVIAVITLWMKRNVFVVPSTYNGSGDNVDGAAGREDSRNLIRLSFKVHRNTLWRRRRIWKKSDQMVRDAR